MSLVISDTSVVPGERWHFPVAATGVDVYAPNWSSLYWMVEQHCVANGAPVPSQQEIIDWCCRELHVPCYDSETRVPLINKLTMNIPLPPTSCCGKLR